MTQIGTEVHIFNTLKERIKQEYDLEDDDPVLLDTVNGEVSLEETILGIIRDIKHTEALAAAIKTIIAGNKARLERFEQKAGRLRRVVAWALEEAGLRKIKAPDVTVSKQDGTRSIIITNEAMIPHDFCSVKYTPSKTKLRNAMEAGADIPGAEWSNGPPTITIRTA